MISVDLIKSCLEGYYYTITPTIPCPSQRVGYVTHRIDLSSNKHHYRCIYIGQTGIMITISPLDPFIHSRVTPIPYADPDLRTKLRRIIGQP